MSGYLKVKKALKIITRYLKNIVMQQKYNFQIESQILISHIKASVVKRDSPKKAIQSKDLNMMLIGCVKRVRLSKISAYVSILIEKLVFN